MEEIFEEEGAEEGAEIEELMTAEERGKLEKTKKIQISGLRHVIEKIKPKRTNAEQFDSEIMAKIGGFDNTISELNKNIKILFSELKNLREEIVKGGLSQTAKPLWEYTKGLENIIKGQLILISYLNIIIEYMNTEKNMFLDFLKGVKDAETEIQLFDRTTGEYKDMIKELRQENRMLINKVLGISESSLSGEELKLLQEFSKAKAQAINTQPTSAEERKEEIKEGELA